MPRHGNRVEYCDEIDDGCMKKEGNEKNKKKIASHMHLYHSQPSAGMVAAAAAGFLIGTTEASVKRRRRSEISSPKCAESSQDSILQHGLISHTGSVTVNS